MFRADLQWGNWLNIEYRLYVYVYTVYTVYGIMG